MEQLERETEGEKIKTQEVIKQLRRLKKVKALDENEIVNEAWRLMPKKNRRGIRETAEKDMERRRATRKMEQSN